MNNHFGFMLLKISGDALAQKNGYIRIVDCAVFTPLVIAYLFSNSVVHNRKLDFFKMCMSIMVWRIGILISNKMVALSVQIFVGIILYGLFLLLMKDEFVMESIRRVKLKI